MQIGQLARQAGVAIDTVRYYERQGLLPPPQRRASGYRQYGEQDISRLRFIRRAKDLGFSLQEIQDLLRLNGNRSADRAEVRAPEAIPALLESRGVTWTDLDGWHRLDEHEIALGAPVERARIKVVDRNEMVRVSRAE